MGWNYRIVRKKYGNEFQFGIHEAFYKDKQKKPYAITEGPMEPTGETLEELKKDYKQMAEAFKYPVLDYDTRKEIKEGR